MKFVPSRDLRIRPGEVWKEVAREGEVVITARGQPVGVLAGVTAETLEPMLLAFRRARAQAAISGIREKARRRNMRLTVGQIDREIREARKARRT